MLDLTTMRRPTKSGVLALAALLLVAGCSAPPPKTAKPIEPPKDKWSALGSLPAAFAAAKAKSPDVRLLTVQSAKPTRYSTGWIYEFVSPAKKSQYLLLILDGKVQGTAEATTTLGPAELKKVPATNSWKIDSDAALEAAVKASGYHLAAGRPRYVMGMEFFKSAADTSTVSPGAWRVTLFPRGDNPTHVVDVDANSGRGQVVPR